MEPQSPQPAPSNSLPETPTDSEIAQARRIIDEAVEPVLKSIVDKLNTVLKPRRLRAGVEVTWFFDRLAEQKNPTPQPQGQKP